MTNPSFVDVDGVQIAFETHGEGYPLLLLHGFPRTRRTWECLVPGLSGRFAMGMPDRRGYGDSDRPADPDAYTLAHMAGDAIAVADALSWERFMVVGHDRGAPVARKLAADLPGRVTGAFIMDSMAEGSGMQGPPDTSGRTWYFGFYRQRGVAEAIMNNDPRLFFSLFLDRNPHLSPEEHAFYVEQFAKPGSVEAVLADYRSGLEQDPAYWESEVEAGKIIETPLHVVWGDRGPSSASPVLESWRKVARSVDGGPVPDAAHYIHEMQPGLTAQAIMRFADALGIPKHS